MSGPGICYTTKKVDLSGNDLSPINIAFIIDVDGQGSIVFLITVETRNLSYYTSDDANPEKLLVFTNAGDTSCKPTVNFDDSNGRFKGVVNASTGQVRIDRPNSVAPPWVRSLRTTSTSTSTAASRRATRSPHDTSSGFPDRCVHTNHARIRWS